MFKLFGAALLLCGLLSTSGMAVAQTPQPSTPPRSSGQLPEIYHTTVRPLCSALRTKIQPSVGMLLQNDETIAKSPALLREYTQAQFNQSDAQKSLTLVRLSNLVTPLAQNVIAIEKLLTDPSVFPPNEQTSDDKKKNELKRQLLESLAQQQASLDIINGFVETQDLADMQHQGFAYLNQIAAHDTPTRPNTPDALSNIVPTPDPQGRPSAFDDTLINAGLPTNPYEVDVTKIPGLSLGYNPVSKLKDGVEYTQSETQKSEGALAKTVMDTVRLCNGQSSAVPVSSPNP